MIKLDDIRYLAKDLYGLFPKEVKLVQQTYELTYSAGEYSELLTLQNPIFVTNVQVGSVTASLASDIYISASANNDNDQKSFVVKDGVLKGIGGIWKYVKVSGSAESDTAIQITIVGYELKYN